MSPAMSMAYGPKTFRDAVGGVRMAKPTTDGYKTVTGKRSKAARASAGARASTAAWTAYPSPAVALSKGSSPSPPATNKFKAGRLQPPITHAKPMATTRNVNVITSKAGPLKATNTGRTHTAGQESPQPPTVTLADFVQHAPRRSASARSLRKRASGSPGAASPSPAAAAAAAAVAATPVKAPSWAAAARAPPAVSASSPRSAKPAPKTSKIMRSSSQGVKAFKLSSATDFPSLRG